MSIFPNWLGYHALEPITDCQSSADPILSYGGGGGYAPLIETKIPSAKVVVDFVTIYNDKEVPTIDIQLMETSDD